MRPIKPLALPETRPAEILTSPPELRHVSPGALHVDESYQRGLSERSLRLIRKIVAEWDWRAFKPPVTVEGEHGLEVIDGQHTAIAAASHGGIVEIPVLVVVAEQVESRADAFVRHNRDRIQVTPVQLHNAMVAAGDEDALTVKQVCERAGVRILKHPPPMGRFKIGDTLAIVAVRALVNRRYAAGARQVLEICVKGGCAPVSAGMIRAVEHLLFSEEYRGEISAEKITLILSSMQSDIEAEAKRFAAERKMQQWRALASVIFLNRRKRAA